MSSEAFLAIFASTLVSINVATFVISTIVECCNKQSIFKASTRKQNEKYWRERIRASIKGFVHSVPNFVLSSIFTAIWELKHPDIYHSGGFQIARFPLQIAIYLFLFDTGFYWQHRLFHIRSPINLYKHVHHYHHDYDPVTSYANQALHPVEAFVSNFLHFSIAISVAWIFPFDLRTHQISGVLTLIYGIFAHDGTFCVHHMIHHDTVIKNFGPLWNFWDVLCNTHKVRSKRQSDALQAKKKKVM